MGGYIGNREYIGPSCRICEYIGGYIGNRGIYGVCVKRCTHTIAVYAQGAGGKPVSTERKTEHRGALRK